MEKQLHIVTHDVPYPVDYGGVFDLFYKIKTLSESGIIIHLHCFEYGRGRQPELNKYCASVSYHKRKKINALFRPSLPYIVSSRINGDLIDRLLRDDHPILLEGIHCTAILNDPRFVNRKILVRLHNVEYLYYAHLSLYEISFLKKIYYCFESRLLQQYEKRLAKNSDYLSVSQQDIQYYEQNLHARNIRYLPVFIGYDRVESLIGSGSYCLYHGNLSVAENQEAASWLIEKIFDDLRVHLVIAGRNPSARLKKLAGRSQHTRLIENPSDEEMKQLIRAAQVNILPSFNKTGIKLKLINALYAGRHCLVNEAAMTDIRFRSICETADEVNATKNKLRKLLGIPFTEEMIDRRRAVLESIFDNNKNGLQLIQSI